MKIKQSKIISTILFVLLSLPLMADENIPLEMGAIVISGESLYMGGETKTRILPRINYQNGLLFIEGTEAGGLLLNNENLKVTGSVSMDTRDIDRGDSSKLSDMKSLDRAIDIKLGARWRNSIAQVKANVRQATNAHKGLQASLELSKPVILGKTKVAPFISTDWMSADTVDYYYGVSTMDAKFDRSIYKANDSFVFSAGIKVMHPITKNLNVLGMLKISQFNSEITDSPIVETDQTVNVGLGLIYSF